MTNIPEFTISEFSRSIKRMVEDNFGYVRLKGEISGFKKASSGHLYFNLKDETALVNAVCFRSSASLINFDLADGLDVIASGKITTYEGRSNYQIIVEKVEIAGIGAILAAIEKRRLRLLEGGYFDEKHKKQLPFLPKTIGIITSPTGAVIEDIIHRISNRFPTHLLVYPAAVQGKSAVFEVINAIKYFNNTAKKPDLIIIARGGGSFEDLLPFNDEELVKEVFKSVIPIISAIGHETDTTLIDYVADVRAPTPSAAAEMAVPVLKDLQNLNENLAKRLTSYLTNLFSIKANNLANLENNLLHPKVKLTNFEQKLSHLFATLKSNFHYSLKHKDQLLKSLANQVIRPSNKYENWQNKLLFLEKNLNVNCQNSIKDYQNKVNQLSKLLISYDYKNVLARGYAVVKCEQKIISSKNKISNNQMLDIEVMDGNFNAVVIGKNKSLPRNKEYDKLSPLLF